MAKYIYTVVASEWSERDDFEYLEVRGSYGTLRKAIRETRKIIEGMCNNEFSNAEIVNDEFLREFTSSVWAEIWLPSTGLHIRYEVFCNELS